MTPSILKDGVTFVAYIREEGTGRYLLHYYREGKLVKSVSDPVPNGDMHCRLAVTSDGKGVVTQTISGKKKGLVKVWEIETKKDAETVTLPPIHYVFPWVQGKYAPVWTSSDGNTYEGGLLEINRSND